MGKINLNQFLKVAFGERRGMNYKLGVFWWRSYKEQKRLYFPFKYVRAYIKKKSSRIGDMWNDKENFKALMRAMGYKKYHDHMKFLKKRKIWDELVITHGKLCVPRRYFEAIGVKDEALKRALRKDQNEYLKAVKSETTPEYYVVVLAKWWSTRGEFPEGISEEEAVELVIKELEKIPDRMKKNIFWAEIVFPRGLKSIYINKKLEWWVSYNYPNMERDRGFYYFFFNRKIPETK